MQIRHLRQCHARQRPTGPSKNNSLITFTLVHIAQLIRLKDRQVMQAEVSQIGILVLCSLSSHFFRPAHRSKSPFQTWICHRNIELVLYIGRHLIHIILAFRVGDHTKLLALKALCFVVDRREQGVLWHTNWRRLLRMLMTERLLHSAASPICDVVSDLLSTVSYHESFQAWGREHRRPLKLKLRTDGE